MTDFFDLPDENFTNKKSSSTSKTDPNIYNPDPNAHNGSYKSVFRLVPYLKDKTLSKLTKYSAKFWNPLTKESLYVDCPSNTGQPSILWDIERVIKGLEKEEPELFQKLNEQFSRWNNHWSPVYIKKDPQRPELEGQIKIFKFSRQIESLIEEQLNPEENDLIDNVQKVNPYHLLHGKDFLCVVGKKTKIFRDWSKCKFMDEVTPLVFKIGDKQVAVENNEKSVKLVQEFLNKNTPSMEEYKHKEWTDDTYDRVAEAIVSNIQPRAVLNMVLDRTKDSKMKDLILEKLGGTKKSTSTTSLLDSDDEDLDFKTPSNDDPLVSNTELEEVTNDSGSDEYDSLFDEL